MTTREFYVNVLDLIDVIESDDPTGCVDTKVMAEKARELIAAMDAKNAKAKEKPRKADPEVAARRAQVVEFFNSNDGEFTADEVAEQTGLTAPQVASAVRSMGETITKGKRKIDSKHSKVTYKRAE